MNKSPEEVSEQKRRWAATHNAKRKTQYHADPEYREKAKNAALVTQRSTRGMISEFKDAASNINRLHEIGKARQVRVQDGYMSLLSFTRTELADALGGYAPVVISRWIAKEQLPAPTVKASVVLFDGGKGSSNIEVYLEEEVVAMITTLQNHQNQYVQYRKSHTETVNEMNRSVHAARKEAGIV